MRYRLAIFEIESLRGNHARQVIQHAGLPLWKLPPVAGGVRLRVHSIHDGLIHAIDHNSAAPTPGVPRGLRGFRLRTRRSEGVRRGYP